MIIGLLAEPTKGQLVSKRFQIRKWTFNKGRHYITYRLKDGRLEIVSFGSFKLLKRAFNT